ncbi:MAG: hypothetical protein ACPHVN_00075 [Luminiphilus sp.]
MTSHPPSHHTLLPTLRKMEQLDIDQQRAKKRETARQVERDPVARTFQRQLKRNLSWMNDHDRSRRLLPVKAFAAWREGFDRVAKMHKRMSVDALVDVLDRQCVLLSEVVGPRHAALLVEGVGAPTPWLTGDSGRDLHRAFQSVHSSLRQLDIDSTTTTIAHLAHCMAKLKATAAGVFDVETGGEVEPYARFTYAD